MKKSELRNIIREELIRINEGVSPKTVSIKLHGSRNTNTWYLTKIDSTHFDMVMNKSLIGQNKNPLHIGQIKGESYYDDVDKWLKGGPFEDGKTYIENR